MSVLLVVLMLPENQCVFEANHEVQTGEDQQACRNALFSFVQLLGLLIKTI